MKLFIKLFCFASFTLSIQYAFSQVNLSVSSQVNTHCGGVDCQYSGPTILINEIMLSPLPSSTDGSLWEPNCSSRCGEWIELYNPDLCESIDISCYYLGNNTPEGSGGFSIPNGTIVPPRGFVVIRGQNAPAVPQSLLIQNGGNTVEVTVNSSTTACTGGSRLWFPNAGGWFAFYNASGQVQDAVSWGNSSSVGSIPCIPTGACGSAASLSNYNNIPSNLKNHISNLSDAANNAGQTLRRIPDGGAWQTSSPSTPTYGVCNSTCVIPAQITCNGTATVVPTGGTAPYTFAWNDTQSQSTATAVELCAGNYCVIVTDDLGATETICVDVVDHVPTVAFASLNDLCINANPIPVTGGTPSPGLGETGIYSGLGISNNNFNPATAGTGSHNITYTFTDTGGCVNTAIQPITVNPLPVVNLTGLSPTYCIGATPINVSVQPSGGVLTGNGISGTNFTPSLAGIGTHTITYEYEDINGCENSATLNVQVLSEPVLTITAPTTLCIYDNAAPLIGTPAGGTFTGAGVTSGSFNPQSAGEGNQTITYSYQDSNGCAGEIEATIEVIPRPALSLGLNPSYCLENGSVLIQPTPSGGTLSGIGIGGNMLDINFVGVGNHSVTYEYTDDHGCENELTKTYTVTVAETPSFDIQELCFQTIKFNNTTPHYADSITSAWDFGGLGNSTETSPTFEFGFPGTVNVTLTITDQNGCIADTTKPVVITPSVLLSQIQIANIITPNGDNINDVFGLPSEFDDCMKYRLIIYNRWGNNVFEMTEISDKFRGISKLGSKLSSGVYYYVLDSDKIDCSDPAFESICKGTITISQ
jgi:gliding motility-associated-like protein